MKSNLKLIKNYFLFFSKKKVNELKNIFHKNIILKDWEGTYKGFSAVIKKIIVYSVTAKKLKLKL